MLPTVHDNSMLYVLARYMHQIFLHVGYWKTAYWQSALRQCLTEISWCFRVLWLCAASSAVILTRYPTFYSYTKGTKISLTCQFKYSSSSAKIIWYFQNKVIGGGRYSISTSRVRESGGWFFPSRYRYTSTLSISAASAADNGVFTCQPSSSSSSPYNRRCFGVSVTGTVLRCIVMLSSCSSPYFFTFTAQKRSSKLPFLSYSWRKR